MPLLTTIATGVGLAYKGGKALGLFGKPSAPPGYRKSPQELASEKLLKKRALTGLSAGERFAALNVGTGATAAYTEAAKRRLEGRAEFQGVSSLISTQGKQRIEAAGTAAVSDISRKISMESEAIKRGAEGQLLRVGQRESELRYQDAMMRYGVKEQGRQERMGALDDVFGGLSGLAQGIQGDTDKRKFEAIFTKMGAEGDASKLTGADRASLFSIIAASSDPEGMFEALGKFGIWLK